MKWSWFQLANTNLWNVEATIGQGDKFWFELVDWYHRGIELILLQVNMLETLITNTPAHTHAHSLCVSLPPSLSLSLRSFSLCLITLTSIELYPFLLLSKTWTLRSLLPERQQCALYFLLHLFFPFTFQKSFLGRSGPVYFKHVCECCITNTTKRCAQV